MTPDAYRYAAMAKGQRVCRPFHLRWLIPAAIGARPRAWQATCWVSAATAALGVTVLARQLDLAWGPALAAGLLFAGLPSTRFSVTNPLLVDAPTAAVTVWAAVATIDNPVSGIILALLAGCVNERAPIFAALFAWSPVPLVGLIPVAVRWFQKPGEDVLDERNRWIVEHPVQASREFHRGLWRHPLLMVAPWGGCLVALVGLDWKVAAAVAVAYLQLLVATDSVRLYQQAAPVVCVAAVTACPPAALPLLVVAHWVNPWAGNGV